MKKISVEEFLPMALQFPVLDVRSPLEYEQAHIPGAISFPLFTDEERKKVGTAYKQESREKAVKLGLDYFGPKLRFWVEWAETIGKERNSQTLLVHCWRGGMRSQAMAWLLELYGFEIYLLQGGYKAFRHWALQQFENEQPFLVLGGYTGSGKTDILSTLAQKGESVLDLEGLASHKGSSFGHLGMEPQPSVEMFENQLAMTLWKSGLSGPSCIWMEAESRRIGNVNLPNALFEKVKNAPVLFLDVPFEERLNRIVAEYGAFEKEALIHSVLRIRKRLGGLETKNCINHLLENQLKEAFAILLRYYDKWYDKSTFQNRLEVHRLSVPTTHVEENAALILSWKSSLKKS